MFHVGQRVVCIRGDENTSVRTINTGNVYTIAAVRSGGRGVRLVEAKPEFPYGGYVAARFRPVVVDRLAIFHKMLAPTPEKERA